MRSFGLGGRTAQNIDGQYINQTAVISNATRWKPDIIVLCLGMNDAKVFNWNKERFVSDYERLARELLEIETKPLLFLMTPPPTYRDLAIAISQKVVNF